MHARVMNVVLHTDKTQEAAQGWKERVSKHRNEGMKAAFLLVNEQSGETISITIWESEAARDRYNANPRQMKAGREMAKYFKTEPSFSMYAVVGAID